MTCEETEIVADAGTRLRIIADGLLHGAATLDLTGTPGAEYMRGMARHVDEVRVRLCALPLEPEPTMAVCETCRGWGLVRPEVATKAFGEQETCPRCGGTGACRVEPEGEAA